MTMPGTHLELTHMPSVKVGMLVRRPPAEVFRAFTDPAVTTRFWFTKSSGPMTPGADLRWDWEMYGVSARVRVKEVDEDSRILFEWNDPPTTVELRFIPWENDTAYVRVTETGLSGDGDEVVAHATESTGGFTTVLCALKALLEHDLVLTVVEDHHPKGVEL